jgi:ATP-dependent exoDNAse (exonuclease V) alpha subunit
MNSPIKRSLAEIIAERKAVQLQQVEASMIAAEAYAEKTAEGATPAPATQNIATQNIPSIVKRSLAEILASKNAITTPATLPSMGAAQIESVIIPSSILQVKKEETFSLSIQLNKEQLLAKELAFNGKSFCLVGAAGTGKTTAQREIAASLLQQNKLGVHYFRVQGTGLSVPAPSIAFVAYTRIASGNLRRAIHKDPVLEQALLHNVTTIHNLLEYFPEFYWDYEAEKEKMRFIPKRNANNLLDITHLIIEESSMVGLKLWNELYEALRPGTQIIFIGDINQLPPVMDKSILNYALVQLPVVELTHVYRQAEESLILENAHKILKGEFPLKEGKDFKIMRNGDTQHSQHKLAQMIGTAFPRFAQLEIEQNGEGYNPEEDIILSPFNKQDLGTDNLNKWIAQFLSVQRKAVTHEVKAGIATLYLAVGDKVMYNKQVGSITQIHKNGEYHGKATKAPSIGLTRFGTYISVDGETHEEEDEDDFALGYEDIDLEKMISDGGKEDLLRSASHIVTIEIETGEEIVLSAVGDFAPSIFSLGYALTIHKAQGCEWRKVFIVLHKDHSIMAFRELLYTAVTRARECCILITKDFMIKKAIENPRIKGNTIEEKIEYFNSGLMDIGSVYCTK